MMISGTPFIARCLILLPVTGCPSVGFAPITRMHSVYCRSITLFVAAPVPNAFCIPHAVGL